MADIIKLNVGGCIYTTSRSTVTRYPNSMLGVMFSGSMPTATDEDGIYWIDGNGDMFRYVLDFLRRGQLLVPEKFDNFDLLERESDFYQIPELIQAVQENKSKTFAKRMVVKIVSGAGDDNATRSDNENNSGTAIVFGPKYALQQLAMRLQLYNDKNEENEDIISYKVTDSRITVCPFPCGVILPKCALMLEICNLGFEITDPVGSEDDDEFYPPATEYWFVKQ